MHIRMAILHYCHRSNIGRVTYRTYEGTMSNSSQLGPAIFSKVQIQILYKKINIVPTLYTTTPLGSYPVPPLPHSSSRNE